MHAGPLAYADGKRPAQIECNAVAVAERCAVGFRDRYVLAAPGPAEGANRNSALHYACTECIADAERHGDAEPEQRAG